MVLKYNRSVIAEIQNDFSILQSSTKQYQGLMGQVSIFEEKLNLDPVVIKNILFKILIKYQTKHKRYHFEVEQLTKQERVVLKKEQSEELKGELQKLLLERVSSDFLNQLVDETFHTYVYDYLTK